MTWRQCCHPYFPVGAWPVHSAFCHYRPRVKLTFAEEAEWRAWNLERSAAIVPTIDELAAIAQAVHEHPAGRALRLVEDTAYTDAHMDDEDDTGGYG